MLNYKKSTGTCLNPLDSDGFSQHIDTISMDLSILHFKGLQVEVVSFQAWNRPNITELVTGV